MLDFSNTALRRLAQFLALSMVLSCPGGDLHAQNVIDVVDYFQRAMSTKGSGLARKIKIVDVRPAKRGEVVITMIKGEGKETQSPPAKPGDMVVRNRCPETGNEEILVSSASFSRRYEGPVAPKVADDWLPYRPRGIPMYFVVVAEQDGEFSFVAPWGEKMVARPGDLIVQDPGNPKDTYRVAKAAFACTYEIVRAPPR